MRTQQRPLFGPKIGPVIAAAVVAAIALTVGLAGPHPIWYVAGCCLLAATLLLGARWAAYRTTWSTKRRAAGSVTTAVVIAAGTAAIPTVVVHRTYDHTEWTAPFASVGGLTRIGDRVYVTRYPQSHEVRDARSGHLIASVPYEGDLMAAADGSFATAGDHLAYYSPDGKQRWRRDTGGSHVLAIRDGWVLLDGCGKASTGCAIAPDGSVGRRGQQPVTDWLDGTAIAQPSGADNSGRPHQAPTVAAAQVGEQRTAVFAADGRRIATVRGAGLGVAGDLVLVVRGNCRLAAYRGGHQQWQTRLPTCPKDLADGGYELLEHHLFVDSADGRQMYAVALDDGTMQGFGHRTTDGLTGDVVGDDVVVSRDEEHLVGVDPDSGRTLWRYDAADRRASVEIEAGAVTLYSKASARDRWLLRLAGRRSNIALQVEVLDARTGEPAGRMPVGLIFDARGIGPGRAAVLEDGRISVIGR